MKICIPIQIMDEKLSMWIKIGKKKEEDPLNLFLKTKTYIW